MTTSDNISAIEAIEKAMEGVTPGRWGQFHPNYAPEAEGTPFSTWDTSHDLSAIKDGKKVGRIATFKHSADAAYVDACNPVAMSAILAEARKAAAMKREIAELRKLLAGDHEVKPLSEERLDEILEFEEQFKMLGGAGDTASLDWATQRALIDEAVLACRARTLLNGGSDAQE